jgi:hypothetical protein
MEWHKLANNLVHGELKECFHCHEQHVSDTKLCPNCRENKDLLISAEDIKTKYKISIVDLDINNVRYDYHKKENGVKCIIYYKPDIHKLVENIVSNLSSKNAKQKAFIIEDLQKKEKEEKESKKEFLIQSIFKDIEENFAKYNIPEEFIFQKNMKNCLRNLIDNYINNYAFNKNLLTIKILEDIEIMYNNKTRIDEKIDEIINQNYRDSAKKHELYFKYVTCLSNDVSLEKCIGEIQEYQEVVLGRSVRNNKFNIFLDEFIKLYPRSFHDSFLKDEKIEEVKNKYIEKNEITYNNCIDNIKKLLLQKMREPKIKRMLLRIGSFTKGRYSIEKLDFYADLYKNIPIKKLSTQIKKDESDIKEKGFYDDVYDFDNK